MRRLCDLAELAGNCWRTLKFTVRGNYVLAAYSAALIVLGVEKMAAPPNLEDKP